MPDVGLLQSLGATPAKATRYVPLSTQKFFSGLWTNRSPFNSPDPRYYARFYGPRTDILIGGANMELTNYNTLIRRPGTTQYSSATVNGTILDFYSYRQYLLSSPNPIDIIVDTTVEVDKVTPTASTLIYTKATGAGQAFFQGVAGQVSLDGQVANTLYIGDNVRQSAWTDGNNGISGTVNTNGTSVTWVTGPLFPTDGEWNGVSISINGAFYVVDHVVDTTHLVLTATAGVQTGVAFFLEIRNWGIAIGSVTGNGPNGPGAGINEPDGVVAWSNPGNITAADNMYASVTVPISGTITSANGTSPYPGGQSLDTGVWQANSSEWRTIGGYGTTSTIKVSQFGLNGVVPTGATITGISFQFGATMQSGGNPTVISHVSLLYSGAAFGTAKSPGASIPAGVNNTIFSYGANNDQWGLTSAQLSQSVVTDPSFGYIVTFANSSTIRTFFLEGALTVYYIAPAAPTASEYLIGDNFGFTGLPLGLPISGILVEIKGYEPANPSDSQLSVGILANSSTIGSPKTTQLPGSNAYVSLGGSGDNWLTGITTTDVMQPGFGVYMRGLNSDPFNTASFNVDFVRITVYFGGAPGIAVSATSGNMSAVNGGYSYVFAYGNSNSGHVSSATPNSTTTGNFSNKLGVLVTVTASTDPQVNQIWIFRTTDGGASNILYNIPGSPFPNTSQTITDSAPDTPNTTTSVALNQQLIAALSPFNNRPPAGLTKIVYYLGRMWGVVGNVLYFSSGPEVTIGNGNEAFPPAFNIAFPTQIAKLVPTSSGLLVFTADDIWIVLGTSSSTIYAVPYLDGVGLLSPNAIDTQGNQQFLYTSDKQFIGLSQGGGGELGFGIGNLLESSFNPTAVYVATLINGSSDKAVYLGDGASGWYRCNWNQPTEGTPAWSPKATITGGAGALASVEVSPGQHRLLIGQGGTILQRDRTVHTDSGTPYPASVTFGNIVLAQPGQLAEAESITVELPASGSMPSVGVLLDEISGVFENLPYNVPDPPILTPSTSLISRRFYFSSGAEPAVFRHLQIQLTWPSEDAANELFTLSIWGALHARE